MPKLNEIVAVVKDRKSGGEQALTMAYKTAQRAGAFEGQVRNYNPLTEDGEQLPREAKNIEATVAQLLGSIEQPLVDMLDTTLIQDLGNTRAFGDIELNGLILARVPATHLLYLEKFGEKLVTFIRSLPVLDPGVVWNADNQMNSVYRSETVKKFRTRKVQKPLVLHPATDRHPAQVQAITEDETVGVWEETRVSGAIPSDKKTDMLRRAVEFRDAVRVAREQANGTDLSDIQDTKIGRDILKFVFG